eukprot:EC795578.1.p3 GENE.EC795578.1~~EC795578.1.p3  ORF type:complete len:83 (+),score=7.97 EC795578.1:352-600(+)
MHHPAGCCARLALTCAVGAGRRIHDWLPANCWSVAAVLRRAQRVPLVMHRRVMAAARRPCPPTPAPRSALFSGAPAASQLLH